MTRRPHQPAASSTWTLDVMANSLVYWVQDLWHGGFMGGRVEGVRHDVRGIGPDDPLVWRRLGGEGALESHCRQLAMEFARIDSGVAITPSVPRHGHRGAPQDPPEATGRGR